VNVCPSTFTQECRFLQIGSVANSADLVRRLRDATRELRHPAHQGRNLARQLPQRVPQAKKSKNSGNYHLNIHLRSLEQKACIAPAAITFIAMMKDRFKR